MQTLKLGDIKIEIIKKDIKNVHLSVLPPNGRVRIAAPRRMNLSNIRLFAISKLSWIKKQQKQFLSQKREPPMEYIDRESHYFWGRRYLLKIIELNKAPRVKLKHTKLILQIRDSSNAVKKRQIIERWYRQELLNASERIVSKWEAILEVKVRELFISRMKTKWGSCNSRTRSIRLNTELAKKPKSYLEYIIVHEMIHLLEHSHNRRFVSLMDKYMPQWRHQRTSLNRLPIGS